MSRDYSDNEDDGFLYLLSSAIWIVIMSCHLLPHGDVKELHIQWVIYILYIQHIQKYTEDMINLHIFITQFHQLSTRGQSFPSIVPQFSLLFYLKQIPNNI